MDSSPIESFQTVEICAKPSMFGVLRYHALMLAGAWLVPTREEGALDSRVSSLHHRIVPTRAGSKLVVNYCAAFHLAALPPLAASHLAHPPSHPSPFSHSTPSHISNLSTSPNDAPPPRMPNLLHLLLPTNINPPFFPHRNSLRLLVVCVRAF